MYCPEHLVFKSKFLWVWMYWRDVPRDRIPVGVWLNPLNYEVGLYTPSRKLVTINREGRWIRSRIYMARMALSRTVARLRK